MAAQNWQGNHIDKDILVPGNNIYSPDFCVFVTRQVNSFILDRQAARGSSMLGVHWCESNKKFVSQCRDPFKKREEHLGYFKNEMDAHLAWKKRKHEHACKLAEQQDDPRVANALRTRYLIEG